MPTNVTREYVEAQKKYQEARTPEEKVKALELMLSTVPKHKGAERLRYELKKNLAKRKRELESISAKKVTSKSDFYVPKEGIAQVALIGPPNSGKSSILNRLTNSEVKVARYPFTTTTPNPGMVEFEDVQIQIVEMPALVEDISKGKWQGAEMLSMIRTADAMMIALDLGDRPVKNMEMVLDELRTSGLRLNRTRPQVIIERKERGGIEIEGDLAKSDRSFLIKLLQNHGYHNAHVIIQQQISRQDLEDALQESLVYRRALIVANKGDLSGTEAAYQRLKGGFGGDFDIYPISARKKIGLQDLSQALFDLLSVIRIYTKAPGEDPEREPLVLGRGSVVRDVAKSLHRRFVVNFRFARVWGSSVNFGGEMVGLDHVLEDGDTVEVHAR